MSKRIAGIALLLFAANVHADDKSMVIGATGWEVFKPVERERSIFDLNWLTHDLLPDASRIGFRFRQIDDVTISIEVDPLSRPETLFGPVTDMNVGATTLSLAFHF